MATTRLDVPEDGCGNFEPARVQGDRREHHLATLSHPLIVGTPSDECCLRDTSATLHASPSCGAPLEIKCGPIPVTHFDQFPFSGKELWLT